MEIVNRKPFQGITNIIRFNWHFYVLAAAFLVLLHIAKYLLSPTFHPAIGITGLLLILSVTVSLLVSFYVYDLSNLYQLDWLHLSISADAQLVNIHAGFDETSSHLAQKYPFASLTVLDFYDPIKHTEVSIKRARKAFPSYAGTKTISTTSVQLLPSSANVIFCILSAHEIRNKEERVQFFQQLNISLKKEGRIVVVEHLRNLPNFIAYNIGFFHFYSEKEW
jgi:hypothetical protein